MNREEMNEFLAGRTPIAPDDLPPFGSRVTTHQGHVAEILGWYSAKSGPNRIDRQRLALAMIIETPGAAPPLPDGKLMFLGYVFENWIAKSEPQRFPRFAKWIRETAVSGMIGQRWQEE